MYLYISLSQCIFKLCSLLSLYKKTIQVVLTKLFDLMHIPTTLNHSPILLLSRSFRKDHHVFSVKSNENTVSYSNKIDTKKKSYNYRSVHFSHLKIRNSVNMFVEYTSK